MSWLATNLLLIKLLPPTPENKGFAMAFWVCQIPAFAGGSLLAVASNKLRLNRTTALAALSASVIALIVDSQLRGHSNLLVAILLLTTFVWAVSQVRPHILQAGLLPYLGRISFSVYILHFAVLGVVGSFWKSLGWAMPPAVGFLVIYLTTLALTAAVATLSFRFIEKPFIRLGRKIALRPTVVAV